MALDTKEKRMAASGVARPYMRGKFSVVAPGDAEWRASSGNGYGAYLGVAVVPVATLTGTTVPNASKLEIVTGGQTTIITLTSDTWETAGATFNAQRQAIINGCTSAQAEATGWNNEVRDNEVVGSVVRTSDTVVTITWSAAAAYNSLAAETITVTVPGAALVGASPLVASNTFKVGAVMSAVGRRGRRWGRR